MKTGKLDLFEKAPVNKDISKIRSIIDIAAKEDK